MNKRILELAEEAGFCFWADESWKPEGATIDWSSIYDEEFKKFAKLVVKECMKLNSQVLSVTSIERLLPLYEEHFGENNEP